MEFRPNSVVDEFDLFLLSHATGAVLEDNVVVPSATNATIKGYGRRKEGRAGRIERPEKDDRQTDRQTNRHTDKQTDRDRQTYIQTD